MLGWTDFGDPKCAEPGRIDALLGAGVVGRILQSETHIGVNDLVLQRTLLGWIVFGQPADHSVERIMVALTAFADQENERLNRAIEQLWELEKRPFTSRRKPEDERCEEIYRKTHRRNEEGRYIVTIPFREGDVKLGQSRKTAYRRQLALEARFRKRPALKEKYIEQMREQIERGYLVRTARKIDESKQHCFIPHHVLEKKTRVVFDASAKTDNGRSLNDIQLAGPRLQKDISIQLLRFRKERYAVVADIKKMFSQVGLDPNQWDLQRILWREDESSPLWDPSTLCEL